MHILHCPNYTASGVVCSLEGAEHLAHLTTAPRGRWMLPVLQLFLGAALLVAREIEEANQ
jgi:hypothetical protein